MTNNLPAELTGLVTALSTIIANTNDGLAGGVSWISLDKSGIWVFGQEKNEIAADDVWAIDPFSVKHGFSAWGDESNPGIKGEHMVGAGDVILQSELPSIGLEWKPQLAIRLTCIEGTHEGLIVEYKNSSHGGKEAIKIYLELLKARVASGSPEVVAIVSLNATSYRHTKWGKTYNPVIEFFDGWETLDGHAKTPEAGTGEPEDKQELIEHSKTNRVKQEKKEEPIEDAEIEEAETEVEEPKTSPRRRRVKAAKPETVEVATGEAGTPRRRRRQTS